VETSCGSILLSFLLGTFLLLGNSILFWFSGKPKCFNVSKKLGEREREIERERKRERKREREREINIEREIEMIECVCVCVCVFVC
jgi:hypothetical protein